MLKTIGLLCALSAGAAMAQTYEVGATGGYGFSGDLTAKSATGSATTGLKRGATLGVFGGQDMYEHWSGEARYLYHFSDLKLSSGGTSVDFGAHEHIMEGAFLYHFEPRDSRVRLYLSVGGGMKVLEGTGLESSNQPLGKFAALTATQELLPTGDVGAGVKINLREHMRLRLEVRDYISKAPTKVIAPYPGVVLNGVLNDVMGLAGISYTF